MRKCFIAFLLVLAHSCLSSHAQVPATSDPWEPLKFLLGTWEAKTAGGTAQAQVIGVYSFGLELNNHVLARHSGSAGCKAPADYDCQHSDLLYLYLEGQSIKAIYLDNEGHTIHYDVSTPTPTSAVFLSDGGTSGPQFRLAYERKDAILSGKFQMKMPGQADFKSYLEWSGGKS